MPDLAADRDYCFGPRLLEESNTSIQQCSRADPQVRFKGQIPGKNLRIVETNRSVEAGFDKIGASGISCRIRLK